VSRFCAPASSVIEAFLPNFYQKEPSNGSSAYARERQKGLTLTFTKQALRDHHHQRRIDSRFSTRWFVLETAKQQS
jgi:hypothetical protein